VIDEHSQEQVKITGSTAPKNLPKINGNNDNDMTMPPRAARIVTEVDGLFLNAK
jgi:hypothetical protein